MKNLIKNIFLFMVIIHFTDGSSLTFPTATFVGTDKECTSGLFAGGGCTSAKNYILSIGEFGNTIAIIPMDKVKYIENK